MSSTTTVKEPEEVMKLRGGSVLGKKTILKSDHFPGCQNKRLSRFEQEFQNAVNEMLAKRINDSNIMPEVGGRRGTSSSKEGHGLRKAKKVVGGLATQPRCKTL